MLRSLAVPEQWEWRQVEVAAAERHRGPGVGKPSDGRGGGAVRCGGRDLPGGGVCAGTGEWGGGVWCYIM